jgi:hypothetical protein
MNLNSELNNAFENVSRPQGNENDSQTDIWEPPFERWMRIADALLSHTVISPYEIAPKPQIFASVHRG